MGNPSTFTIEEKTGKKRKLDLRGRCLPYRPYSLKGKMRAEFTWYPGNATASAQVLGASEDPTTIRGEWKDRFIRSVTDEGVNIDPTGIAMLDGSQVDDVMALVGVVDSFRRSGQLLSVTWDEVVREGVMTSFAPEFDRREKVNWEIEFTWIGQGDAGGGSGGQPVTFAKPPDATDFSTQLSNLTKTLRENLAAPFNLVQDFADTLFGYVEDVEAAAKDVEASVNAVAAQVLELSESGQRALAAVQSVSTAASGIVTTLASTPLRAMQNVKDLKDTSLGDVLATDVWQRNLKKVARDLEFLSAEQGDELRESLNQSDLLATFVARAPMDLRDVSTIYYDTPDEWRQLLQFNNFTSSKLDRGTLVQIPKLQSANRSA